MLTDKHAPPFCQILFLVWFQPKENIYLLLELSFLCSLGAHLDKKGEELLYIIAYTMKNHHFPWMYTINCLIGLLTFFKFKLTITNNILTPKKQKLAH